MLIKDFKYYNERRNQTLKTYGLDTLELCFEDSDWWQNYPQQNFDYQFNSWGFRGEEYTQYIGKPVNICLGDSFTVNVGAPIEYSWCSQIAQQTQLPCINLGIDGAGNDAIKLVHDRACDLFDVQNTFVMYSFFHRKLDNGNLVQDARLDHTDFLQYRIDNAVECFLPFWAWTCEEIEYIEKTGIFYLRENNLPYASVDHLDPRYFVHRARYQELQGDTWPNYHEFINGAEPHPDMYNDQFGNFVNEKMFYVNRDGLHMNETANKIYADYLLSKL